MSFIPLFVMYVKDNLSFETFFSLTETLGKEMLPESGISYKMFYYSTQGKSVQLTEKIWIQNAFKYITQVILKCKETSMC